MLFSKHNFNFQHFVNDYLATAAWVTVESDENKEFTPEARRQAERDCALFIGFVIGHFGEVKGMELIKTPANDLGFLAAHDFFLTRNRQGAGFWDKTEHYGKKEATKLTAIAQTIGECNCYHVRGPKSKLTFD